MRNRTEMATYHPVINPERYPFLHVTTPDRGKTWEYVPSLSGVSITAARITNNRTPIEYSPQRSLEVPLLPVAPSETPPRSIETVGLVVATFHAYEKTLMELIDSTTNIVVLGHGTYWGFLPEQQMTALLRGHGYSVDNMYPKVGGRKRIQDHGVLIGKKPA